MSQPLWLSLPLPWLLSSEAGAGHRAKFRLQTAKQPVTGSLVAMQDTRLTVPCKSHFPISIAASAAPMKMAKHDPS